MKESMMIIMVNCIGEELDHDSYDENGDGDDNVDGKGNYHKMMMMMVALLTQERLWRSSGSAPCSPFTSPTSYSR